MIEILFDVVLAFEHFTLCQVVLCINILKSLILYVSEEARIRILPVQRFGRGDRQLHHGFPARRWCGTGFSLVFSWKLFRHFKNAKLTRGNDCKLSESDKSGILMSFSFLPWKKEDEWVDLQDLSMLNPSVPLSVSFSSSIPIVSAAASSSVDVPVSHRIKSPLQSPIRAAQSKFTKKLVRAD